MADVDSTGVLVSTRFHVIPLGNTAQTEGSLEEIQTDSNWTGTSQSAGELPRFLQKTKSATLSSVLAAQ